MFVVPWSAPRSPWHAQHVQWFEQLFGFVEDSWERTQARFSLAGTVLTSSVNGRSFEVGAFETPTVGELRTRVGDPRGAPRVRHQAIGDVLELHATPEHHDAMFQVASQLNCLEFMGPREIPENGVTDYARDPTQGPACSLAAAAATVYRNYFVPVEGVAGQRANRQLNNLADALARLGSQDAFVTVQNGYAFSDEQRLRPAAAALDAVGRDAFVRQVRIGIQKRTQVTFASRFVEPPAASFVSQAFCSALSCGYDRSPRALWAPLAKAVLDAAYEATLLAAREGVAAGTCSGVVWLTFLGGGAFGNDPTWIADAIARAVRLAGDERLDIRIAHYREIDAAMQARIDLATSGAQG